MTDKRAKRPRGTGSLFQQKTSRNWFMQFYCNGTPHRLSTGTDNKRLAEKILQQKLAECATDTFIEPKSGKILISELIQTVFDDYKSNGRKSLQDAQIRWNLHLAPVFGNVRAANLQQDGVRRYILARQAEGAANATINREVALLKRAYTLAIEARKLHRAPKFPHLKENNVRKGFLTDEQYGQLAQSCSKQGVWMRAIFEVGYNFGLRENEVISLRVEQFDRGARMLRLEETKNGEARNVPLTSLVYNLLLAMVTGKQPHEHIFTRPDGKRVRVFRDTWWKVCVEANVGRFICAECAKLKKTVPVGQCSEHPQSSDTRKYVGLLFHDLRRSAIRNMVRRGIPERVAMLISGHKTRSVFDRYNIVSESDLRLAAAKLEERDQERAKAEYDHTSDILSRSDAETNEDRKPN